MSLRLSHSSTRLACLILAGVAASASAANDAALPTPPALKFATSATLEQGYDDNVMLQSVSPAAHNESWVSQLAAQASLDWRVSSTTAVKVGYAPSWTRFHSMSSEDFFAHRVTSSINGREGQVSYTMTGSMSVIDGSDESPIWTGAGGAPATGGATVRDRRDQAVYRANARLDWVEGPWLVRPIASLYVADFQTVVRSTAGCQNYIDRDDLSAGLDIGRVVPGGLTAAIGYRHGQQNQARVLAFPEEYDNSYDRVLANLEGAPTPWLKLAISVGPEFRRYGPHVHATFPNRSVTNLFLDASATIAVTKADSVSLLAKQFEQLSSSGRGAFEDLNFDLAWRHVFSSRASAGIVLHAYNTDFLRPATRNDWLVTARLHGSLSLNDRWALDASTTYEEGISRVPATPGREYARNIVSAALKTKF